MSAWDPQWLFIAGWLGGAATTMVIVTRHQARELKMHAHHHIVERGRLLEMVEKLDGARQAAMHLHRPDPDAAPGFLSCEHCTEIAGAPVTWPCETLKALEVRL